VSFFSFTKIREQEGRTGPAWGSGSWYQWEGRGGGERVRKVNMVQKMCTYVCKCKKNYLSKPFQEWEGVKESNGGGELKYDIFDTL
jgi:hypothetical protein